MHISILAILFDATDRCKEDISVVSIGNNIAKPGQGRGVRGWCGLAAAGLQVGWALVGGAPSSHRRHTRGCLDTGATRGPGQV